MLIKIHVDGMKEAEQLSAICKDFTSELLLRGGNKFCVDPKSTLGIFAIMYSSRDNMMMDTGDMEDTQIPVLIKKLQNYIIKDEKND